MMIISRTRKVSVFYNKLGHVDEDEEHHDDNDKDYSDLAADDEDEDYAFPLDAIKEESEHASLYENPHQPIRDQHPGCGPIRDQYPSCGPIRSQDDNGDKIQERIVDTEAIFSPPQQRSPTNTHHGDKRKLSLGVILRKLSTGTKGIFCRKNRNIVCFFPGSQPARERKASLQERRLSSALSKLITPIFERRTLGERSYQV